MFASTLYKFFNGTYVIVKLKCSFVQNKACRIPMDVQMSKLNVPHVRIYKLFNYGTCSFGVKLLKNLEANFWCKPSLQDEL